MKKDISTLVVEEMHGFHHVHQGTHSLVVEEMHGFHHVHQGTHFYQIDLEVLAETIRILKLLRSHELIAIEQRERAEFCARYCEGLQLRVQTILERI